MIRYMSNCVQQNRQSKHKTMKRKIFSKIAASLRLVISPRMSNIWIPPSNTSRRLTNLVKKPLIWHLFFSGRIKVTSNPDTHICVLRLLIPEEPGRLPGHGDDAHPRSSKWHKPLKKPSGAGLAGALLSAELCALPQNTRGKCAGWVARILRSLCWELCLVKMFIYFIPYSAWTRTVSAPATD